MAVVELLRNSRFNEWAGGFPTVWSRLSTLNTTYRQLSKRDPKDHPQRRVFAPGLKVSDVDYLIGGGENGLRLEMAGAVAANDWVIRQAAAAAEGIQADPNQRLALRLAFRCSVDNNLLRVQVIGLLGTGDVMWLVPQLENRDATGFDGHYYPGRGPFTWTETGATDIILGMKVQAQFLGLQVPMPLGISSISVRLSNGSVGPQVIDIGEVSLTEVSHRIGGRG